MFSLGLCHQIDHVQNSSLKSSYVKMRFRYCFNSDIDISYTFKIMNQFLLKISLNLHGNISIEKEVVPKNQKFISVSKRQQPFIALYSY